MWDKWYYFKVAKVMKFPIERGLPNDIQFLSNSHHICILREWGQNVSSHFYQNNKWEYFRWQCDVSKRTNCQLHGYGVQNDISVSAMPCLF